VRSAAVGIAALVLLASAGSQAQTQTSVGVPGKGNSQFETSIQYIRITHRELGILREEFGEITLRSMYLSIDYGLTDRLALNATLPYKSNRYKGDQPHDPRLLADDRGERFRDDGSYHSSWGDAGLNLRWLWRTDPIAITPFIGYYWPTRDYPLFTETQAGTAQWRIDIGANAGGRLGPPRRNLYWTAGYAYSFMQKTRPRDAPSRRVNRSRLSLETGWVATPTLTGYLNFSYQRPHNALKFPDDFTGILVSDQWYFHDQLLPWEQVTWALGASYQLSDRTMISGSFGRTLWIKFGHEYNPALTLSISRSF
jgi:hypothetical protein